MAEETPDYEVIETFEDNIEIRRYQPMLLAETVAAGDRSEAASAAFRILADYIFGNNQHRDKITITAPVAPSADGAASEKITMTAPVTQAGNTDGKWTVSFMMPSKYDLQTLPRPNNPKVVIRETQAHTAAAIRFSGPLVDGNMEKHRARLEAFLAERGLKTEGPAAYAYYNGPMTPFFLRRNEVIYRLRGS